MERHRFDNIEMDSTLEYHPGQRDMSDPEIELRAHARQIDAGQLLARNTAWRGRASGCWLKCRPLARRLLAPGWPSSDPAQRSRWSQRCMAWTNNTFDAVPNNRRVLWSASLGVRSRCC